MKYLSLLILAMTLVNETIAQTMYESPHVKDGKTMQISVPEEFNQLEGMSTQRNAVFSTEETVDFQSDDFAEISLGLFTVSHMSSVGESLESLKIELMKEIDSDKEDLTVLRTPEIIQENGRKTLRAGFKGNLIDEEIDRMYLNVFEFGDYFVMTYYMSTQRLESPMQYDDFVKACNSWKEIATTKEDEYSTSADEVIYEDYSEYFPNDLFETEITYYDILPDFVEDWDDMIDESGHLLSLFSYKEDNGFIKIFSGGLASNYPSEEEMANAIELAMDWTKPMTLEFKSQFSNEDHVFRLYTISGGGTMSSVYTAEVNNELVFFVVDGGANPVDDFKPAVREFMLTMWIDYFDGEKEETEE